jgi:hypothetical protein
VSFVEQELHLTTFRSSIVRPITTVLLSELLMSSLVERRMVKPMLLSWLSLVALKVIDHEDLEPDMRAQRACHDCLHASLSTRVSRTILYQPLLPLLA